MYIRQLPVESATVAAMRGGDVFRGWGQEMYMLANVIDAIRENTWVTMAANAKRKPKPPEPVDRPKAKAKKKPNLFAAMARAAWKRNRGKKDGGN